MAYNSSYSESDVSGVALDGVTKIIIVITQFVTLIVLVFLFVFLKKKWDSR